jgi:hypothetical protein
VGTLLAVAHLIWHCPPHPIDYFRIVARLCTAHNKQFAFVSQFLWIISRRLVLI